MKLSEFSRTKKRKGGGAISETQNNEAETNSNNKNIKDLLRAINEFMKGYQPRTNLVKDEDDEVVCRFPKYFKQVEGYFCNLLNLHDINNVRQTKMYMNLVLLRLRLLLKS